MFPILVFIEYNWQVNFWIWSELISVNSRPKPWKQQTKFSIDFLSVSTLWVFFVQKTHWLYHNLSTHVNQAMLMYYYSQQQTQVFNVYQPDTTTN